MSEFRQIATGLFEWNKTEKEHFSSNPYDSSFSMEEAFQRIYDCEISGSIDFLLIISDVLIVANGENSVLFEKE